MSVPLTIQGVTFNYPVQFETNWGPTLTNWSSAVTAAIQPLLTGGSIRVSPYPGAVINFANATNSGFLPLAINGSNQLTFNGTPLATSGGGTVNVGTQYQLGYYAANGIAISGLTLITPNKALESDANGLPIASGVSSTTLAFLDATSSVQTQLNSISAVANAALPQAGGTMSGNIAMGNHSITGIADAVNPQDVPAFHQIPTFTPPTGSIIMYGASSAPSGWLKCDGTSYNTGTQATLFAIIGYTFGGGGASFNVPNLVNNVPIGAGSTAALGVAVGANTVNHTHTENAHTHDMTHQHTTPVGTNAGNLRISGPSDWGQGSETISLNSYGPAASQTVVSTAYAKTKPNDVANTGIQSDTGMSTATTSTIQPSLGITYIIKA